MNTHVPVCSIFHSLQTLQDPIKGGTCSRTVFSTGAHSILHSNHQDNDAMLILRTFLDTKIHLKSKLDQAEGNENICYHDPIYGILMCCLHCTLLCCFNPAI